MTTLERLKQLLVQNFKLDAAQLTPDQPLTALGMDSLGMVELMFMIEDEFGIKLPPDTDALPTLQDAVRCVDKLMAAQRAAALPQQPA